MAKVDVYDSKKKSVGSVELPEAIFGVRVNEHVLWEVVQSQRASRRAGTHSTKKRGDVSGGGKKPYKQKGTGNARHGSIREPQMRHGGNVFGPLPRDYAYELPKKVRRLGLVSALSQRVKEGKVTVVDGLSFKKPSTKGAAAVLKGLGVEGSTLIVVATLTDEVTKSFRNLKYMKVIGVDGLNVYDVLRHTNFIVEKGALAGIEERLSTKAKAA